jgi:hypothetical protein
LSSADLLFVSRFYTKQIFVVSRFLFCQQMFCRRHLVNDAHAGIVRFAPACFLTEKFRLRPARIFASITIPFILPDLPGRSGPSRHPGGYWRRLKCLRQPVAGWRDANFLAVVLIHRVGKVFSSSADSIFVSRFRQQIFIISRFRQLFFFLSADSVSRFLK